MMSKAFLIIVSISFILLFLGCQTAEVPTKLEIVDAEEFWENRDSFLGKEIILNGTVLVGDTATTDQVCPVDNPCCRTIFASAWLETNANVQIIICDESNAHISCSVNNCEKLACGQLKVGERNVFRARIPSNFDPKIKNTSAIGYIERRLPEDCIIFVDNYE